MNVKVSVCITTYDRAQLLDRSLASLAKQTRLPDELIISDDCSPDHTQEVVEKWRQHFPTLRYQRNATNLYMPGNLNAAIGLATGEYIANLHDGDEFAPTLLEKWEGALDRFPSAGFVFSGVGGWKTSVGGDEKGEILHDVDEFTPGREFYEKHMLHSLFSLVWGTVMARRATYDELLPFDPEFGFISDVDMWMRISHGFDVAYVREPLIILDHSPTAERGFRWDRIETSRQIQLANIYRFYGDDPVRLEQEIARHRAMIRRFYLRRLLGRILRGDWAGVRQGLSLLPDAGWGSSRALASAAGD